MLIIRRARVDDASTIAVLQRRAILGLAGCAYDPAQVAFLGQHSPDCTRLIADGTLLVAERDGRILGTAGWMPGRPSYGPHLAPAPARTGDAGIATIRMVYVDPSATRAGLGTRLMAVVEDDLLAEGFARAEMLALLSGVGLYRHLGYAALSQHMLRLPDSPALELLLMEKALERRRQAA